MSLLHSFYCWGQVAVVLLSTLFLRFFGKSSWKILVCLWAIIPLFNVWYFSVVPIRTLVSREEGMKLIDLLKTKIMWLFFLLMLSAGASELAMAQWASAFAEMGLNVSKTVGDIAGPCFFAVMMGLARTFYGKYGEHIELIKFIIGSALLCIVSYLIAGLCPSPIFSLIGCGICGLSVGIMWPGVFSMATKTLPKGGTAMFALLALCGDMGCLSGPGLVGVVSERLGDNLKLGLLSACIFPAMLVVCAIVLKRIREAELTQS